MIMSRKWVMPNKWMFAMEPVQELFSRYAVGPGWVDPFAGKNSPAEWTNDIEDRGAKSQRDALEYLKSLESMKYSGSLFDPPYSVEQCLRKYTPKQGGTAGRAEYWAKCKDELSRISAPNAYAISFCWDSTGLGKKRGFEIVEVMLLCHGACHNDTIITVERALSSRQIVGLI